MPPMDPEQCGWELEDGKYKIRWYTGPATPLILDVTISDATEDEVTEDDAEEDIMNDGEQDTSYELSEEDSDEDE